MDEPSVSSMNAGSGYDWTFPFDGPAVCLIVVQARLDQRMSDRPGAISVETAPGYDSVPQARLVVR